MKRIKLEGYLEYDDQLMHGNKDYAYNWFINDILLGPNLILYDNEIGDVLGTFTVEEIK